MKQKILNLKCKTCISNRYVIFNNLLEWMWNERKLIRSMQILILHTCSFYSPNKSPYYLWNECSGICMIADFVTGDIKAELILFYVVKYAKHTDIDSRRKKNENIFQWYSIQHDRGICKTEEKILHYMRNENFLDSIQ